MWVVFLSDDVAMRMIAEFNGTVVCICVDVTCLRKKRAQGVDAS